MRDPERGCPWDAAQDFRSLAPLVLEEVCELAEAAEQEDFDGLREELGDVLLHVALYARLAAEARRFDFADVVGGLIDKLVRRHPHVFANGAHRGGVDSPEAALAAWRQAKALEAVQRARRGALDGIPPQLSALSAAEKMQSRAAGKGMERGEPASVRERLDAELAALDAADGADALERALGEALFGLVEHARALGVPPERSLRAANRRFRRRFEFVERGLSARGVAWEDAGADALKRLWRDAERAVDGP